MKIAIYYIEKAIERLGDLNREILNCSELSEEDVAYSEHICDIIDSLDDVLLQIGDDVNV